MRPLLAAPFATSVGTAAMATVGSVLLASAFFLAIGQSPPAMFGNLLAFAFGDAYSISETLVKAAPILACALAAAVPGRLGLVSVGAEGQFHAGAIAGTAVVLAFPTWPAALMLPVMLLAGAAGGGLYGALPGFLKARLDVNETISTLLLNYVAVLQVNALVYGPWRDPANLGWPATAPFPDAAILPAFFGTRAHLGFALAVLLALLLAGLFARGRWARGIRVLAGNRKVGETFGLNWRRQVVVLMLVGGGQAGLGGIAEASAVQGRLQPGLSAGFGLTGFLVAWLCGHRLVALVPASLLVGGLLAAGDALQLFAKVPAASATILQGLIFVAVLGAPALRQWIGVRLGR